MNKEYSFLLTTIPSQTVSKEYFFENEVHAFENKDADEFVFAEFFVPGIYKTIWAKDANVCTWLPTGKDLRGRKAARHIEKHVAGEGADI